MAGALAAANAAAARGAFAGPHPSALKGAAASLHETFRGWCGGDAPGLAAAAEAERAPKEEAKALLATPW